MTKLLIALTTLFCLAAFTGCYFDERRGLEGKSSSPLSGSNTNGAASGDGSLSITDMNHMNVGAASPRPMASPPSPVYK